MGFFFLYFLCSTNCKHGRVSQRGKAPAAPASPVHTEINRNYSTYKQLPGKKVPLNITLQRLHVFRWAKGGMQVRQVRTIQPFILGSSRMLQEHSRGLMHVFQMYFSMYFSCISPCMLGTGHAAAVPWAGPQPRPQTLCQQGARAATHPSHHNYTQ